MAFEAIPDLDNRLEQLGAPYVEMVRQYIADNPDEFVEPEAV